MADVEETASRRVGCKVATIVLIPERHATLTIASHSAKQQGEPAGL